MTVFSENLQIKAGDETCRVVFARSNANTTQVDLLHVDGKGQIGWAEAKQCEVITKDTKPLMEIYPFGDRNDRDLMVGEKLTGRDARPVVLIDDAPEGTFLGYVASDGRLTFIDRRDCLAKAG